MNVGDRVKITETSKYRGRIGTIIEYLVPTDAFHVMVDDDRPFVALIYGEQLEPYEDIQTFTSDEFNSIFES